jgi:hypothetical protein
MATKTSSNAAKATAVANDTSHLDFTDKLSKKVLQVRFNDSSTPVSTVALRDCCGRMLF